MICEFCGGKTKNRRVEKSHWLHNRLYFIENVEAEVCCDCGERYFHARVLDTINAMLQTPHKIERCLEVEVVRA
ncbi:MAG: YgiT-type zinc finger protein [Candidatus Desantisbacteria bacterium]